MRSLNLYMISLFVIIVLLLLFGTAFYHQVEHWKILDSFYFTVTTLTTVGYGDFTPRTDIGKLFTAGYILIGVGLLLGFVGHIARHTHEKDPVVKLIRRNFKKRSDS